MSLNNTKTQTRIPKGSKMSGFQHDHPGYQRGQKMEREGKIEPRCGGYHCFEDGNLFGGLTLGSMTKHMQ